jgi:putative redox protein
MTDETPRTIEMSRLAKGRYVATNARGGQLVLGQGDESFSPVELLLVAIAGCSAIDVDYIVSKRAEPTRLDLRMSGDKIRDDQGNRMTNLTLTFDVAFPDDEGGQAAYDVLPRAVQQSHDRLCTVSRTVEVGSPITTRIEDLEG